MPIRVMLQLFMGCLLNIQFNGVLNNITVENMFSNISALANINMQFWSECLLPVLEHSKKDKCLFNLSLLKQAFSGVSDLHLFTCVSIPDS